MTITEFATLVTSSGLLAPEREATLRAESQVDSAAGYASFLVARNALTEWQSQKLFTGKYKGFFVDHYKLLSHLDTGDKYSRYLAEDIRTGAPTTLKLIPGAAPNAG